MADLQRIGGGAVGLGGTLGLRQFADEPGQKRYLQPSVVFGLGTGAIASGIYLSDFETPVVEDGFWASHALLSIPTGLFMLAFPPEVGQTTTDQLKEAVSSVFGGSNDGTTDGTNGTASSASVGRQSGANRRSR